MIYPSMVPWAPPSAPKRAEPMLKRLMFELQLISVRYIV